MTEQGHAGLRRLIFSPNFNWRQAILDLRTLLSITVELMYNGHGAKNDSPHGIRQSCFDDPQLMKIVRS